MTNWLKLISDVISHPQEDEAKLVDLDDSPDENVALLNKQQLNRPSTFFSAMRKERTDPTFAQRLVSEQDSLPKKQVPCPDNSYTEQKDIQSNTVNLSNGASMRDLEDQLSTLKRLREMPRGTQVESRIGAITDLLGEVEIFKTLQMLRWPQGVVCPRCKSSNVVRREPPVDAPDQRHFYICLSCKGEGDPSDFDDFTGLPLNSLYALRQCILCWYLIGFCSIHQIAKVLGLSLSEVMKLISISSDLGELSEFGATLAVGSKQNKAKELRKTSEVEKQEEETRSESRSPFKPGYKSKK